MVNETDWVVKRYWLFKNNFAVLYLYIYIYSNSSLEGHRWMLSVHLNPVFGQSIWNHDQQSRYEDLSLCVSARRSLRKCRNRKPGEQLWVPQLSAHGLDKLIAATRKPWPHYCCMETWNTHRRHARMPDINCFSAKLTHTINKRIKFTALLLSPAC